MLRNMKYKFQDVRETIKDKVHTGGKKLRVHIGGKGAIWSCNITHAG